MALTDPDDISTEIMSAVRPPGELFAGMGTMTSGTSAPKIMVGGRRTGKSFLTKKFLELEGEPMPTFTVRGLPFMRALELPLPDVDLADHEKQVKRAISMIRKEGRGLVDAVRDMHPEDKLLSALRRLPGLKVGDIGRFERIVEHWNEAHTRILEKALEQKVSLIAGAAMLDELDKLDARRRAGEDIEDAIAYGYGAMTGAERDAACLLTVAEEKAREARELEQAVEAALHQSQDHFGAF